MTKILVYGTLRRNGGANRFLQGTAFLGETRLPGYDMINLGGFPGIVPNPQNKVGIVGEVYDGVDEKMLDHLDHYEGYHPDRPKQSCHYLRETVNVGGDDVFVYVYNRPVKEWGLPIKTGDWDDR